MALPAEFNTVTLTGVFINLDGTPTVGYLMFKPSPVILRAGNSKDFIVPTVLQVNLADDGSFSIVLPANDDPDITPGEWTYEVTEAFGNRRTYSIEVHIAGGDTQNLYDLAPIPSSTGIYSLVGPQGIQGIQGPKGDTGATAPLATTTTPGSIQIAGEITGTATNPTIAATPNSGNGTIVRRDPAGNYFGVAAVYLDNVPTTASQATRKDYVDALGATAATPSTVARRDASGNLTAVEVLLSQQTTAASAVRKDYADALGTDQSSPSTIVRRTAGSTFGIGAIDIWNVPTAVQHATRKDYVDGQGVINRRIATKALPASGAAYTLVPTDEAQQLYTVDLTNTTVTVPTNAAVPFQIGAWIEFRNYGGGNITLAGSAGVTINGPDGNLSTRVLRSTIRLLKIATDVWSVAGDNNSQTAQAVATANSVAVLNGLVKRDAAGRARFTDPVDIADAATKYYVDSTTLSSVSPITLTQQASDPAAPTTTGQAVVWKATDKGVYVLSQDAAKRRMCAHWGTGTAYPTVGVLPGDTFFHSTYNCLFVYNGTFWRQEYRPTVANIAALPAAAGLYDGYTTWVTSKNTEYRVWDMGSGTLAWHSSRPFGKAYANASGAMATGDQGINLWPTVANYDSDNMWTGTTHGGFTLPVAGIWRCRFHLNFTAAAGFVIARVNRNPITAAPWTGAVIASTDDNNSSTSGDEHRNAVVEYPCNIGDVIGAQIYSNVAVTPGTGWEGTGLSVEYVGPTPSASNVA